MTKFPEEYEIISTRNNNNITFAIKKETIDIFKKENVENKDIIKNKYGHNIKYENNNNNYKILGWNAVSIASSHNNFLLNNYLDIHKPDFILINEVGATKDKFMNGLNEEYNIIAPNRETGIIFRRKFKLRKILSNLTNDYLLISKVETEEEEKNLILISAYAPPNEYKHFRLDYIVSVLNTIIVRYREPQIIVYGDFNIKREEFILKK